MKMKASFLLTVLYFAQARAISPISRGSTGHLTSGENDSVYTKADETVAEGHRILNNDYHLRPDSISSLAEDGTAVTGCGPLGWRLDEDGRLFRCEQMKTSVEQEPSGVVTHFLVPEFPGLGISLAKDQHSSPDAGVKHKPSAHNPPEGIVNKPTEVVINQPIQVVLHKPHKPIKPLIHKPIKPLIHKPIKPLIKPLELKPIILKPIIKPIIKPIVKPLVLKPIVFKPIIKPIHKPLIIKPLVHHPHEAHLIKPIVHKPIFVHQHHASSCHQLAQSPVHLAPVEGHHPSKEQEHYLTGEAVENPELEELHHTGFGAVSEINKASPLLPLESYSFWGSSNPWNWVTLFPADYSLDAVPNLPHGYSSAGVGNEQQVSQSANINDKIDTVVNSDQTKSGEKLAVAVDSKTAEATTLSQGLREIVDVQKAIGQMARVSVASQNGDSLSQNTGFHFKQQDSHNYDGNRTAGSNYDERINYEPTSEHFVDEQSSIESIDRDDIQLEYSPEPQLSANFNEDEIRSNSTNLTAGPNVEKALGGGPDVTKEHHGEQEKRHIRIIREAPSIPIEILQDQQRSDNIIDRATLLEILSAFKEQYLKNAEPDQRKFIEDAIDRLHSSMRDMKKTDERVTGKGISKSKLEKRPEKAVLELLAEKEPLMDEPDYYNDATDYVAVAEPSFMELLNVADKHRGKSNSQLN